MAKLLWQPGEERKRNANITKFMELVNERYGKQLRTYEELHRSSIDNLPEFYASIWDLLGIKASKGYETVVEQGIFQTGSALSAEGFEYIYESAVGNIVNGRPVTNRDALSNPESLQYYERIAREELQS